MAEILEGEVYENSVEIQIEEESLLPISLINNSTNYPSSKIDVFINNKKIYTAKGRKYGFNWRSACREHSWIQVHTNGQ